MEETTTTAPAAEAAATPEATETPAMVVPAAEGEQTTSPETMYADKFTSVGELEKSYKELESTFSKKLGAFEGAPEEYSISDELLTDDAKPVFEFASQWGRENQLSNEGMENLVKGFTEFQVKQTDENMKAEYNKLGSDAEARLTNARQFLESNLGEDGARALGGALTSAAAVEALEKLIASSKSPSAAPTNVSTKLSAEKVKSMRFTMDDNGNRRMESDPAYRAEVLKAEQSLLG